MTGSRARALDPLWLAFGTLTALRVPAPSAVNSRVAGRAMVLAPLAAVPLALIACALVLLGQLIGLFPLVTAVAAIGAVALGSRGLHLDGLADTADGLSASYDRARALDVMRRGDVGPMGVATVVLVVLGQVGALTGALFAGHGLYAAALGVLTGRLVITLCCARGVPSARAEGLGATVAGSVPRWQAGVVLVGGVLLAALTGPLAGVQWWRGGLAVLAGSAVAGLLLARCVQRLGGVTGDVLGACVEVGMLGALVVFAS